MNDCCLYVMVADFAGESFCKIGITNDLGARLGQVQVGCPVPIAAVAYLPMPYPQKARTAERIMHADLKEFRSSGEWFRLRLEDPTHKARFHAACVRALQWSCSDRSGLAWKHASIEALKFASKALRLDEVA